MSLGIILYQFQTVLATDIPYLISIGTATVEVNNHYGAGTSGDGCLNLSIVNLERIDIRLY